jgi:hypothetical protein
MKSCRGKRKDDSRLDGRRIARLRTLAAAIGVFGALALNAGATVTNTWAVDADGIWSNAANWASATVPATTGDVAKLTYALTANRVVTLDTPITLGELRVGVKTYTYVDLLGPQAMLDWYRAAREAAPDARLTFNEPGFGPAGMEIGSFPENLLGENCRGWVDYLVRSGAPLDALGSQCHGGAVAMDYAGKTGAEGLWAYYDHLAGYYGKKLQYTELDVNIGDASDPDQQVYQADMLRDSIIIAFAHPAFVGVTQWGFWAGAHYAPNAALWNRDWSIRPAGQAYVDLVTKRWRTEAELTTGNDGICSLRAFHGEYDIAVGDGAPAPLAFPSGDLRARLMRP